MKSIRLVSVILSLGMALGLAACGGDDDPPAATVPPPVVVVPPPVVEPPVPVANTRGLALTGTGSLLTFNLATPGTISTTVAVTGLVGAEQLVGIDVRPKDGVVWALGSLGNVYTVNPSTGVATTKTTATLTLTGTEFGFDFNPMVDRIRITSNSGMNLRFNPDTGALAATDTTLAGGATGASAVAYTNSVSGVTATATVLYDIDEASDTLYTQNPPNNGTLVTVGALGLDVSAVNGFDIDGVSGMAYATFTVGGTTGLYRINLTTGAATLVGSLGSGAVPARGFTLLP